MNRKSLENEINSSLCFLEKRMEYYKRTELLIKFVIMILAIPVLYAFPEYSFPIGFCIAVLVICDFQLNPVLAYHKHNILRVKYIQLKKRMLNINNLDEIKSCIEDLDHESYYLKHYKVN